MSRVEVDIGVHPYSDRTKCRGHKSDVERARRFFMGIAGCGGHFVMGRKRLGFVPHVDDFVDKGWRECGEAGGQLTQCHGQGISACTAGSGAVGLDLARTFITGMCHDSTR